MSSHFSPLWLHPLSRHLLCFHFVFWFQGVQRETGEGSHALHVCFPRGRGWALGAAVERGLGGVRLPLISCRAPLLSATPLDKVFQWENGRNVNLSMPPCSYFPFFYSNPSPEGVEYVKCTAGLSYGNTAGNVDDGVAVSISLSILQKRESGPQAEWDPLVCFFFFRAVVKRVTPSHLPHRNIRNQGVHTHRTT